MTHSRHRSTLLVPMCIAAFSLAGCLLTAPSPQSQPPPPAAGPTTPPATAGTPRAPAPRDPNFADPPPRAPLDRNNPPPSSQLSQPSRGPVGSTVVVRGDFRAAAADQASVVAVFAGAPRPVRPQSIAADQIVLRVPAGSISGNVQITMRRRVLWRAHFDVTPPVTQPEPAIDCKNPPSMMCCKAMTEVCLSCARRAKEARVAWEQQCQPIPQPAPPIDCSTSPPRRACCTALTDACTKCQQSAAEENRRWDAACMKR